MMKVYSCSFLITFSGIVKALAVQSVHFNTKTKFHSRAAFQDEHPVRSDRTMITKIRSQKMEDMAD